MTTTMQNFEHRGKLYTFASTDNDTTRLSSDEIWFIVKNKVCTGLDMASLQGAAKVWTNVRKHGCTYSQETMSMINELALNMRLGENEARLLGAGTPA